MRSFYSFFLFSSLIFLLVACDNGKTKVPDDTDGQNDVVVIDDSGGVADTGNDESSTDDVAPTCGNGMTDTGEACDGDAKNCAEITGYISGWAECKSDCSGYDTTACTAAETDDETVIPDEDTTVTVDVYAPGAHGVLQKDIAKNASGNANAIRIFYPADAGTYPYINFIHGFQLKNIYYDQILTQLASHGFIIVSIQFEQSLIGGATTIEEATAMVTFLDSWIVPQLGGNTAPAVPDFTKVGLAGHSRGGKTSWRVMLANSNRFQAIAGVDPVLAPPPIGSDPNPITGPVSYSAPSLLIGTELGPTGSQACAPADGNSAFMYPNLPLPTWHLIGGGIGHMDMMDPDDISACGFTCSVCDGGNDGQKTTFRALAGGLLVAFFRAALYGETALYDKLVDTVSMPHPISKAEHK